MKVKIIMNLNSRELKDTAAFAARQAIMTRDGFVLGYELLFRKNFQDAKAEVQDSHEATARALTAVALNIGWNRFFEGALAFVNVDINFIENGLFFALPARTSILEIARFQKLTARQRHALAEARHHGYIIAWDDVHDASDPRFEFAKPGDYIKINSRLATVEDIILGIEICLTRQFKPIVYKIESRTEQEFFIVKGAAAVQGNFAHRPERRSSPALPMTPVNTVHEFRRILSVNGSVAERVALVERSPELFLTLLMLTDIIWQPHWPYPNTIEQLLRGFSRASLMAWLELILFDLYRENNHRRQTWAISFLQPAIFSRLIVSQAMSYDSQLSDEAYMLGFVSQILSTHPDFIEGNDAPIHLGKTLSRIVGFKHFPLQRVFNYVSAITRSNMLSDFSEVNLPPAISGLLAKSQTMAIETAAKLSDSVVVEGGFKCDNPPEHA
jgi:EAL and modified HD-GYP domain-containing signal transduction protein